MQKETRKTKMQTISLFLSALVLALNFLFRQCYRIFDKARYAYGVLGLSTIS
jgi:hypothetical protein